MEMFKYVQPQFNPNPVQSGQARIQPKFTLLIWVGIEFSWSSWKIGEFGWKVGLDYFITLVFYF